MSHPIEFDKHVVLKTGLLVRPVTLEHTDENAVNYENEIRGAISASSSVLVEYFPPEYEHLLSNPVVKFTTNGNAAVGYFRKVAEIAAELEKRVIVLDPARDLNFGIPRITTNLIGSWFNMYLPLKVKDDIFELKNEAWMLSRREILIKALGIGINSGLAGTALYGNYEELTPHTPTPFFYGSLEGYFRRAVVAKGMQDIKEESVSAFYPNAHWAAIEWFLSHPRALDLSFLAASSHKLFGEDVKRSLFSARSYVFQDGNWVQKDSKVIK